MQGRASPGRRTGDEAAAAWAGMGNGRDGSVRYFPARATTVMPETEPFFSKALSKES
jgi:hypothetical protein